MEQEKRDAGEILNNRARILINLVVLIVTAVQRVVPASYPLHLALRATGSDDERPRRWVSVPLTASLTQTTDSLMNEAHHVSSGAGLLLSFEEQEGTPDAPC